jgi:uracil-DNA glycosylase family 4
MNQGFFFSPSEIEGSKKRLHYSAQCGACGMHKHCKNPKMSYSGKGQQKILIVGEAPGKHEDEINEQFVGKAGKRLQRELKRFKLNMNLDCWKTNAVRCRPKDNKTPDRRTIAQCRPALFAEIRKLQPKNILIFGGVAAESILGHLWGGDGKFSMARWVKWVIPHQNLNAWISVHYHPSYLERQQDALLDLLFRRWLRKALQKKERPWKKVPSFADDVDTLYDQKTIIRRLKHFYDNSKLMAFDYETNCLKPEYKGAEIVSCAFSNGVDTFAFPWTERIAKYVSLVLRSDLGKIASNLKFEERWTRHFLGHGVRNWDWDTMLSAHILNNATGVTGLKFQSFVRLGQASYDEHIEPYLKSPKGQHINRIKEIPLKELLIYNGMDALLEYKLAAIQKRETGDGHK